jgi:hypothetical protein
MSRSLSKRAEAGWPAGHARPDSAPAAASSATTTQGGMAVSPARSCCGPFWAALPPASACAHSRTTLLTFNIIMGGALTGAPFNPARALGPMVATGNFNDAWLYLTAPIVGAIVAALLHTGLTRLAQEGMAAAEPSRAARTPAE